MSKENKLIFYLWYLNPFGAMFIPLLYVFGFGYILYLTWDYGVLESMQLGKWEIWLIYITHICVSLVVLGFIAVFYQRLLYKIDKKKIVLKYGIYHGTKKDERCRMIDHVNSEIKNVFSYAPLESICIMFFSLLLSACTIFVPIVQIHAIQHAMEFEAPYLCLDDAGWYSLPYLIVNILSFVFCSVYYRICLIIGPYFGGFIVLSIYRLLASRLIREYYFYESRESGEFVDLWIDRIYTLNNIILKDSRKQETELLMDYYEYIWPNGMKIWQEQNKSKETNEEYLKTHLSEIKYQIELLQDYQENYSDGIRLWKENNHIIVDLTAHELELHKDEIIRLQSIHNQAIAIRERNPQGYNVLSNGQDMSDECIVENSEEIALIEEKCNLVKSIRNSEGCQLLDLETVNKIPNLDSYDNLRDKIARITIEELNQILTESSKRHTIRNVILDSNSVILWCALNDRKYPSEITRNNYHFFANLVSDSKLMEELESEFNKTNSRIAADLQRKYQDKIVAFVNNSDIKVFTKKQLLVALKTIMKE